MSKSIHLRYLSFQLKAIIPLILISFLLIAGFPGPLYALVQQPTDSAGVKGGNAAVKADTAIAAAPSAETKADTAAPESKPAAAPAEAFDEHSHKNLQRGERLFMGLLPAGREYPSCVSCHNITHSDTLNWNPSAMDIAVKYAQKDFTSFQNAVMQPSGVKMAQVHKNFNLEENDLHSIKIYLDELAATGPPKPGPTITQLLLFIGLGLLLTWALLDLLFFHKVKYKVIPLLILLGALTFQLKMVAHAAIDLGRSKNYAPDQPIKFSHKVHAGANRIDCKYCHHTAEFSKSAGIPSMNLCMNCHILVREGSHSGQFEIAKVIEANETKKPVAWTRIHNLPDHVFFSHAQHVGIAKVDCKQCHGPVQEMDIMRQHSDLSMGWCINCHRQTEVQFKNNAYYDNYLKLHDLLKSGKIDKVTASDVGANDCMRCHY
ncbi:MAG TPA: cytochrome c3 family protein [Prolixibacteraceae bacterium]|nr:cytochrome c3 family protein [Prolixibacteraceae bacterium]